MFQSTRPGWAATENSRGRIARRSVSIHAARVGRDENLAFSRSIQFLFQSTRPGWAATLRRQQTQHKIMSFNPRGPGGPRLSRKSDTSRGESFNPRGPGGPRQFSPSAPA